MTKNPSLVKGQRVIAIYCSKDCFPNIIANKHFSEGSHVANVIETKTLRHQTWLKVFLNTIKKDRLWIGTTMKTTVEEAQAYQKRVIDAHRKNNFTNHNNKSPGCTSYTNTEDKGYEIAYSKLFTLPGGNNHYHHYRFNLFNVGGATRFVLASVNCLQTRIARF